MVSLNWSKPKHDIKAIIIYPNRQIQMKRVKVTDDYFKHEGRTFLIDEKSIYFLEKTPVSIYHFKESSPKIVDIKGIKDSMESKEVSAVMETKVVEDIIRGAGGSNDYVLWAAAAAAILSLLILLNDIGLLKLGGQ